MYGFDVYHNEPEVIPEDFPWSMVAIAAVIAIIGVVGVALFWGTILKYVFKK